MAEEVREHLKQITDGDVTERAAAWLAFLKLDEDAVQLLADELYSGVNEQTGVVILELMAEIGGWEAMIVLQDIYQAGERDVLVKTAAKGLARNGWDEYE